MTKQPIEKEIKCFQNVNNGQKISVLSSARFVKERILWSQETAELKWDEKYCEFIHDTVNSTFASGVKKALGETQKLRAGCSEPKNFAPPQNPFPGVQDGQNLIGWR